MKPINGIFRILALGWAIVSLAACAKDNTDPVVDLRYDVEDEYIRDHTNPETVTLRVRSLYTPWEVSGSETADWYTITPSHGEAGETAIVTITLKNNPDLDDREDTIYIKSDYWTGKQFRLFQHGTAFLEADDMNVVQDGDEYELAVLSNQKWSAAVTDGEAWLTINSGTSGENNGTIKFATRTNKGEQRPGTITIYDRYDRPTKLVTITQNGYVLSPIYPEDPDPNEETVSWIRLYHEAQTIEIPVESNAHWVVAKENPDFDDWYELAETEFDNDGTIRVILSENTTSAVRTATLVLNTESDDPEAIPVVKTVKFKQANLPVPETQGSNITVNGTPQLASDLECGRYDFTVVGAAGASMQLNFVFPNVSQESGAAYELRYWTNSNDFEKDGLPIMSSTPWLPNPCNIDVCNKDQLPDFLFDKSEEHKLSLEISKRRENNEDGTYKIWPCFTWYLDDVVVHNKNGLQGSIVPGMITNTAHKWNTIVYDDLNDGHIRINANGKFTILHWEYTAPINWGSAD